MVQSFNSLVLRWMKKHRNEIPRGQLSENLTRKPDTTHYALRFCVKYLLSNCMCRPDFISYKWADRKNPGFFSYRRPVWTKINFNDNNRLSFCQKYDMFNIVILGRCLLFEKKAFISALNLPRPLPKAKGFRFPIPTLLFRIRPIT